MIRITIPLLLVFSLLSATVINVPGDHATIQAGEFHQTRKMILLK